MNTVVWTILLGAAFLWPSHVRSLFDGMPLDRGVEAIACAIVLPCLWLLDRTALRTRIVQGTIVALLALRVLDTAFVQEGLCAHFSTGGPLEGTIQTIPISEPAGVLRSWDVRTQWRSDNPTCTAILDRPYSTSRDFPVWFVNILDHLRPPPRDIRMHVAGSIAVSRDGRFRLETGEDMSIGGTIAGAAVSAAGGSPIEMTLSEGTHAIDLDTRLTGERWRFVPTFDGVVVFRSSLATVSPSSAVSAFFRFIVGVLSVVAVILLLTIWTARIVLRFQGDATLVAWTIGASLFLGALGLSRMVRFAPVLLVFAGVIPVAQRHRNLRGALALVGVPWLALIAVYSAPLIGRVTAYSADDWLTYQVAAARIYMHGFWLEGGNQTFDYQPLYRWIAGLLHVVFGDSSVGETYFDAFCLLAGSLLTYHLSRRVVGFRGGIVAAGITLATFTTGTVWYFIGRGLSEIAAAGFAFLAAFCLLRARLGNRRWALAAAVMAILMFYTRLNHLLFAVALLAVLLPMFSRCEFVRLRNSIHLISRRAVTVYATVFAAGVVAFATRTWWYTGVFSILYGTSLKNNDTGLGATTLLSLDPWRKVAHSLGALVWMNEPPRFDMRSVIVAIGTIAAVAALLQLPRLRAMPASVAIVTVGATASAFLVHSHNYPGRMSVHLVPFAVAAACAAVRVVRLPA